jgi:hypothetical protein
LELGVAIVLGLPVLATRPLRRVEGVKVGQVLAEVEQRVAEISRRMSSRRTTEQPSQTL